MCPSEVTAALEAMLHNYLNDGFESHSIQVLGTFLLLLISGKQIQKAQEDGQN